MVMVTVSAKGALWGANVSLSVILAIGVVIRVPSRSTAVLVATRSWDPPTIAPDHQGKWPKGSVLV